MIAAAEFGCKASGWPLRCHRALQFAPHTSLRINQLHHRNPMLLGAFAALDVGRHIIALARLVHGIIDLDLSTVEMKRQSRRLSSHTPLRASANTPPCRSLPPGSVLRPAVASAQDALEPQSAMHNRSRER